MQKLSYINHLRLRKILKIVLIVFAAILLLSIFRFIYLERFIVYDETGAHLDFGGSIAEPATRKQEASDENFLLKKEPATGETIHAPENNELPAIHGIYVSASDLSELNTVSALISAASKQKSLLLELKSDTGKYLYDTALSDTAVNNAAAVKVKKILNALDADTSVRLIACIPAFKDSAYALADYSRALTISGGALWMDSDGSYCLDPASEAAQAYLVAQAKELQQLGFDEVLFKNFDYPESGNIVNSSRSNATEAVRKAAANIVSQLESTGLICSFSSEDETVVALSQRAFITAEEGELVSSVASHYNSLVPNGDSSLVFLTDSRDSRFSSYSTLSSWESLTSLSEYTSE